MIGTKCPGQDMRYWTADDAHEQECPQCGEMVEFFKTDIRLRCPNCKTRIANDSFNMGCAEWCAYAEQCLGPAAKGLKGKPLRTIIEETLSALTAGHPVEKEAIQKAIARADRDAESGNLNLLPLVFALTLTALEHYDLVNDAADELRILAAENTLPQQAVSDTLSLIESYKSEEASADRLLKKYMEEIV